MKNIVQLCSKRGARGSGSEGVNDQYEVVNKGGLLKLGGSWKFSSTQPVLVIAIVVVVVVVVRRSAKNNCDEITRTSFA